MKIIKENLLEAKYKLIFQNEDFLVIEKPAGLIVHPKENKEKEEIDFSKTLVGQLLVDFPQIKNVGEKKFRPGIVHRLDKETSGLMLIALNQESFLFFKKAFSERRIEKKYWALVWGKPKKEFGTIQSLIGRSHNYPDRQSAVFSPLKAENVKPAESFFQFKESFGEYSLLEMTPKTGRKHQLRVHLHLMGFPIVGDKKYQTKALRKKNALLNRHFLHAFSLKFVFSDGKEYFFQSPWPKDFQALTEGEK